MVRVACLARVSTMEQHSSIDNQKELFDNWIKRNKGCSIEKVYIDEGISGAKGYKRKQWLKMLEDGKDKKFDVLLAKSYSRFGRNQRETLEAISMLRENNIRIIFLEDNLDSKIDSNKFGLFAWLAEQEAQKTSERIKMVWDSYNQEGKVHVCLAPYGYNYDVNKKNFVVNVEEAIVIKKIFNLYIQGNGFNKIAKVLHEEDVRTKRGGKWSAQTIRMILTNTFYLGILTQGKTRTLDVTMDAQMKIKEEDWYKHLNNHEAIICEEIFSKAQEEIKKRSNKKKRCRYSNKALFSNIIKCGECGSSMTIKRKKSLKNFKPYYQCIKYDMYGKVRCNHTSNFIWEDMLIEYINSKLDILVKNNYKILKEKLKHKGKISNQDMLLEELRNVKKQIDRNVIVSNKLLENYTESIINENQYRLQNKSIANNLDNLLKRKEELESKIISFKDSKEDEVELIGGIDDLLETSVEKWNNAMIMAVINKINIYVDGTICVEFKYIRSL
ncbi:MAG: recombinase family protein [Clostridium sp.]|uniref:recombinase family protein n=1 Tax=Clostridium sp. TaxID=1506 RepID=UPI003F3F4C52